MNYIFKNCKTYCDECRSDYEGRFASFSVTTNK
jgi:hypothetical protein